MRMTAGGLDAFVSFVDEQCAGDLRDPRVERTYQPLEFIPSTRLDPSLDPFGEHYLHFQLELYREIAGRPLDQWSGELHPVDIASLVDTANPQGINDVSHVSENVRAVSTMLSLACLGHRPRVLDMGAGHGMSSEVYAFCGADVHAIDIDPQLSELALQRAARRSLRIRRSILNFDSLAALPDATYDGAFFFQSLHHAVRPWDLIAQLGSKLADEAVIGFCGEPVQDLFWKHWGLRLDLESVYVARKYGWFESGWSRAFITDCFRRCGFQLALFQGGHLGGLIGIATRSRARMAAVERKAGQLEMTPVRDAPELAGSKGYATQIGAFSSRSVLGPFVATKSRTEGGYLCFGPYTDLEAGLYRVSFLVTALTVPDLHADLAHSITVDVVSEIGTRSHFKEVINVDPKSVPVPIAFDLLLPARASRLEVRVFVPDADAAWEISLPIIARAN